MLEAYISPLHREQQQRVEALKAETSKYAHLDDAVLYAILASREVADMAGWQGERSIGVNIGSSRGATTLFEKYHESFLTKNVAETLSSPTTTLGNISSWVAHDLGTQGPEISHSITCSTALHALVNGVAWLRSGMATKFLVGGSEASLTPFTVAQMQAMKIYANGVEDYPCRALDLQKSSNSMVIGEGASMACLETKPSQDPLAVVEGIGYATEPLTHNVSISSEADCFQRSMKMALGNTPPEEVDVVVMHAPGTVKGDLAEYNAIKKVFNAKMPALTTNKWKVGHTLGASGMLSVELALLMMMHQEFIPVPFIEHQVLPEKLEKIMVNAVGFGGNAVSILLSRV